MKVVITMAFDEFYVEPNTIQSARCVLFGT